MFGLAAYTCYLSLSIILADLKPKWEARKRQGSGAMAFKQLRTYERDELRIHTNDMIGGGGVKGYGSMLIEWWRLFFEISVN